LGIVLAVFATPSAAQHVVIDGVGTVVDRSLIVLDMSAANDKINFLVTVLRPGPREVAQLLCEDKWDPGKAYLGAVVLAEHLNASIQIQFVPVLASAGFSGCRLVAIR
jgi:hypothetical protein